jgi:hypothetical protein
MPSDLHPHVLRRHRRRRLGWVLALLLLPAFASSGAEPPYVGPRERSLAAADELGWIVFDPERRALRTPERTRPGARVRPPEDPAAEWLMRRGGVGPWPLARPPSR